MFKSANFTYIEKMNFVQNFVLRCAATTADMLFTRSYHYPFNRAVLKAKVRTHFPKPREIKRINVHGWDARMSTLEGRRVLMRRILKGRHVLSH